MLEKAHVEVGDGLGGGAKRGPISKPKTQMLEKAHDEVGDGLGGGAKRGPISRPKTQMLEKAHVEVGDGLGEGRRGGPIPAALENGARHLVAGHAAVVRQQQHLATEERIL